MMSYSYAQVFNSPLHGFIITVPIVFVGAWFGMMTSFLISRYFLRDYVQYQLALSPWFNLKFKLINEIVVSEGFKIVSLLRLTFAPIGVTSYILGITEITFRDYIFGNVSYLFKCSLHAFIGCQLYAPTNGQLNQKHDSGINDKEHDSLKNKLFLFQIIFTGILTMVIAYVAKDRVETKMKEQQSLTISLDQK